MKVESVQLLLSLLHWAEGIQESSRRGKNNQWEEKLPVLSQREFDRERLGIQFPFMKDKSKNVQDKILPIEDASSNFIELNLEHKPNRRCVQKVMMEEKVEYDKVVECEHSYDKKCFTSLSTVYKPYQEEKCKEDYVKECFIKYEKAAMNVTTTVCRRPLVRDCDVGGSEEVCITQYEAECSTREEVHQVEEDVPECETVVEEKCQDTTIGYTTKTECKKWPRRKCSLKSQIVRKVTPDTSCRKIPVVMCGPKGCGFSEGAEECRKKVKTVIFDKPEEECKLDPRQTCKFVTKLSPQLKKVKTCIDVPKEICEVVQRNPHKVKYPVIKNWCYTVKNSCSKECSKAAKAGKCLQECRKHSGNPACCAPTCPVKCTSNRQGECSDAGVEECGGIPGCCPDRYDLVLGDVAVGGQDGDGGYGL